MTHDQLFKDLLRAFLPEFITLFFPEAAARLDFREITFLDKEVFTDLPRGRRRELDLVVRLRTRDGRPELILIHIEVQARRTPPFPYRMFEYGAALRLRHRVPVFPIVVYLAPGAGGLGEEVYREAVLGREVLTYRYACVGLPDLPAVEYLQKESPLAAALAAVMDRQRRPAYEIKAAAWQGVLRGRLDEARTWLLLNLVETYTELSPAEQAEFQQQLREESSEEDQGMLTYETKLKMKLAEQLEEEFRVREAQLKVRWVIETKRDTLLRQLQEKFGALLEGARARVASLESEADLDRLLSRVVKAQSLAELGLE